MCTLKLHDLLPFTGNQIRDREARLMAIKNIILNVGQNSLKNSQTVFAIQSDITWD